MGQLDILALQATVAALAAGQIDAKAAAKAGPAPVGNVLIVLGPDKGFGLLTNKVLVPKLKEAGAKVTVVGDGENPVSNKDIRDAMAAIKEPTTLLVMSHGVDDGGRYKITLGRDEKTYVEDAVFAHVPKQVKGICLMGCNAEAALGKNGKGEYYIDALPKGTEVRGFSAADDVTSTFDYMAFGTSIAKSGTTDNKDFSATNLWRDFVSTDLDHSGLKFGDKNDTDGIPAKVGISGKGVVDLQKTVHELKGAKFSDERMDAIYGKLDNDEAGVTRRKVGEVAQAMAKGRVFKDDMRLAVAIADVELELRAKEKALAVKPPALPMDKQTEKER